jgi:hypothetical protein
LLKIIIETPKAKAKAKAKAKSKSKIGINTLMIKSLRSVLVFIDVYV